MRMYFKRGMFLLSVAWIVNAAGCNLTGYEERYSYRVLADVTFLSVPDSSRFNIIRVSIAGVLGLTSGCSFDAIESQRADTLLQFAVYAREVYDSAKRFEAVKVTFDTTIVVSVPQPPLGKRYYFQALGANQVLQDSSFVY